MLSDCRIVPNPLKDDGLYLRTAIENEVVVRYWMENDVLVLQAENCYGEEIGKRMFKPVGTELESVKHCGCLAIIEVNKD